MIEGMVGFCLGDIWVDFLGLWGELVLGRITFGHEPALPDFVWHEF